MAEDGCCLVSFKRGKRPKMVQISILGIKMCFYTYVSVVQKYSEINAQLFRCMVSREDWHDWPSRVPCVDDGTNRCGFHVHAVAVDKVDGGMEV